jgi:hypothetical protein
MVAGALVLRLIVLMCMSRMTGIDFLGSTKLCRQMNGVGRRGKMLRWVGVTLCTVAADRKLSRSLERLTLSSACFNFIRCSLGCQNDLNSGVGVSSFLNGPSSHRIHLL